MTINISNVVPGTSLAISVSGTARLQRALSSGQDLNTMAPTQDELDGASGRETPSQALAKASPETLAAIEKAMKAFDPTASLSTYTNGKTYSNGSGLFLHLIA